LPRRIFAPASAFAALALCSALALAALGPAAALAQEEDDGLTEAQLAARKPVKTLIGAIRQSKDDLAASFVAYEAMCRTLLDETWNELTEAERKEFVDGFAYLLKATSFPKARELFAKAETALHIEYEPARIDEAKGEARIRSLIVIHSQVKKDEITIEYLLRKIDGQWLIYDTEDASGESTLAGIREDQVIPLLDEGGPKHLLATLRKKVAEAKAKAKAKAGTGS